MEALKLSDSESDAINESAPHGVIRSQELIEEEFERFLSDAAKQEITNEEVSAVWRTEIYGEEGIRKTLMLDRWVGEKFTESNIAMINFTEYMLKVKEDHIYQQLGFSKFEDWIQNHGISMSTVDSWQKVYDVYIKGYGFMPEEIASYDIKKLKIILPLAEMETVTKERVEELFDSNLDS